MAEDAKSTSPRPERVELRVARIVKAHGLKGGVKLELYTDDPELRFQPGASFSLQVPQASPWFGKSIQLASIREINSHPVAFFEGIEDRTLAEGLDYAAKGVTGFNFYSPRGQLQCVLPYAELRRQAVSTARKLLSLGLKRGDRVAVVALVDVSTSVRTFATAPAASSTADNPSTRPALDAVRDHSLDGEPRGPGPRDVLCQHILMTAASGPFDANDLFTEVTRAGPYATLTRPQFDACLDFCATGGYALRAYDKWRRLQEKNGRWQLRDPRSAALIR